MKRLVILLCLMAIPSWVYAAEVVYVQSVKANIVASPAFKAEVLAAAMKGDKLNVLEKTSAWYKVSYNGKEGWISGLLVSPNPPMEKVTVLAGKDDTLEKEARRRASTMTTAAAARGLAAEERARLSQKGFANYAALDKVDAVKIEEKDVISFHEEGLKR